MSKLLIRIVILIGTILAGSGFYLYRLPQVNYGNYMASVLDKENNLKTTPSPRIILIGGSNITFGVDSQAISEAMHMPVINMGIHAGIGLRLMLAQVKPYLHPGDIVLLIPEYEQFLGNLYDGNTDNIAMIVEVDPKTLLLFEPDQYLRLPEIFRFLIRFAYARSKDQNYLNLGPVYQRSAYNKYGDMVAHLDLPPVRPIFGELYIQDYYRTRNPKVIPALNKFKQYVEKKGAAVYFIYPVSMTSLYDRCESQIDLFSADLSKNLQIPILGTARDMRLDDSFFYDTFFHLMREGGTIRTNKIIDFLKQAGVQAKAKAAGQ